MPLLVLMNVSPLSMMSAVNKEMKRVNGNRRHAAPFLDVVHQNLPGNTSLESVQIQLDIIVHRYRPAVVVVSEMSADKMEQVVLEGYTFVRGKQKNFADCRVSMFVQKCLPMEELNVVSEVPVVGVRMGEYNILGVYREWARQAD